MTPEYIERCRTCGGYMPRLGRNMDIFGELRSAVMDYEEWSTDKNRAEIIHLARRFVHAVDSRAVMIEHMRQNVMPSEQALQEIMNL